MNNLIKAKDNQYVTTLIRKNRLQIQIVATFYANPKVNKEFPGNFDIFAVEYNPIKHTKKVHTYECSGKSLNGMSVDEYIKNGRIGLLSVVSPFEILITIQKLKTKLISRGYV